MARLAKYAAEVASPITKQIKQIEKKLAPCIRAEAMKRNATAVKPAKTD